MRLMATSDGSALRRSKRLEFLLKMTSSGNEDPFVWYGLAMEYRSLGRFDEALATFEALRGADPGLRARCT